MKLTKLTDIIPLGGTLEQTRNVVITSNPELRFRHRIEGVAGDDNKSSANSVGGVSGTTGETVYFPMLVGHMLHQTEMELIGRSHCWTFRDILDRLLSISGLPLRYALELVSLLSKCLVVCFALFIIYLFIYYINNTQGTEHNTNK